MFLICANKETILILEDCYFKENVTFSSGYISIVNPQFIDTIVYFGSSPKYKGVSLTFWEPEDVELTLGTRNNKDYEIHNCIIRDGKRITIKGDASNIKIDPHNLFSKHGINNIHLRNVENFTFNKLTAENIIIEDSTGIEFNEDNNYKKLEIDKYIEQVNQQFIKVLKKETKMK